MNLRQTIGKSRKDVDSDLNVTPVMNIFVILIPFLLLTATFIKIAIIDLTLPTLDQNTGTNDDVVTDLTVLVVSISPDGFQIKTSERNYPIIKKKNGGYDLQKLGDNLAEIKKLFPLLEDIVISPTSEVIYQVIINVLDECREVGFPNYSISG